MNLENLEKTIKSIKYEYNSTRGLARLKTSINRIKSSPMFHARAEKSEDDSISLDKLRAVIADIKAAYEETRIEKELKNIVSSIRKTYIQHWKEDNINFVSEITEVLAPDKGLPTPVLSVCGRGTREIRFTRYLAYYLDSRNNHGLGGKLLYHAFNNECRAAGLSQNWHKDCSVKPECYLGDIKGENGSISCIADIVITGDNFVIILEHKILAGESAHPEIDLSQLERYSRVIEDNSEFKDRVRLKILLNPSSGDNGKHKGWIQLSHAELIERGIKLLESESLTSAVARENLTRLLIDLAAGPYEVMLEELESIYLLGESLLKEKFNARKALKFDRLTSEHEQIINIIREG